jgi:hypothetical protein
MFPSPQKKKATPFDSPVSIHVHSKRRRLIDIDNQCAKQAIDGFVLAGILQGDSPEYVTQITITQEKISNEEDEETIFEFRKSSSQ